MNERLSVPEKLAQLQNEGKSWPSCECHGEPKIFNPWPAKGGGYWQCRIKKQENSYKQRLVRKASGLCQTCANSSEKCECRARGQVWAADLQIQKYERLLQLDKDDPEYIAIVRREQTING